MFPQLQTILDRGRREARLAAVIAVVLVLVRSAVYLVWEHIDFNSDQAIVGLMAKHLSEFREFPLFFYGQNYMLGIQAWFTAPMFWIARPSVAALKAPLMILNAAVAVVLVRSLAGNLGLRPLMALVAALPFIVPTPPVSATLLQTIGSSGVEPILYVLLLWFLRMRPFAFGAVLAVGFLHREFTMYALPAFSILAIFQRSVWTPEGLRRAGHWLLRMAGAFGLVWLVIDGLKLYLEGTSLMLQAEMLGNHVCLETGEFLSRVRYIFTDTLPVVSGGRRMLMSEFATRSSAVVGSSIVGWVAAASMALMLVRLAWHVWRPASVVDASYGVYLMLVGACALAAYPLACGAMTSKYPTVRYLNMAVLLPAGCFAAFIALEPSRYLRAGVTVAFVLWGAANFADNVRTIRAAVIEPLPNPHRELTNFLLARRIEYARAPYWDAYVVDFLSNERITVASFGPVRIPEYERQVDANRHAAVDIQRKPCRGWAEVAAWCIEQSPR